jgi:hypothetical protein
MADEEFESSSETEEDDVELQQQQQPQTEGEKMADVSADSIATLESRSSTEGSETTPVPAMASTQSVSDDFVVVCEDEVAKEMNDVRGRRLKGDGYVWQRRLVFRAKLTMHTAFERADNVDPAAVTALAVSKDHRTIYVGDEKGRVFSWAVSSKPGKGESRKSSLSSLFVSYAFLSRRHG